MNAYLEHLTEDRRLCILRVLAETPAWSANESILQSAVGALGHSVSRDQVRTDLAWLEEQGLVRLDDLDGLFVCVLRRRGHEVAEGRATVPGIKTPGPRP